MFKTHVNYSTFTTNTYSHLNLAAHLQCMIIKDDCASIVHFEQHNPERGWLWGLGGDGLFKLHSRASNWNSIQRCSSPQHLHSNAQDADLLAVSMNAELCHHRSWWFLIWVCQISMCTVKRFFKSTVILNCAHVRGWLFYCGLRIKLRTCIKCI